MQKSDYKLRNEIKINNVVTTTDLKQTIDISIFNKFQYLSCDLDLYKCGYVKDDKMQGKVSVFASGKLISVGTKNPKNALFELNKVCKILKKYNFIKSCKIDSLVRNIVCTADLGMKIDLNRLSKNLSRSTFVPENFSGLTYKLNEKITVLVFASGKVVMTGGITIEELNSAYFELKQLINAKISVEIN